jgi:two-component system NtrC family sensor kinase
MASSGLILVALDDEQLQRLFEHAIASAGYKVALANDRAAIERVLYESIPDLIIVGENFSGSSGMELAGEILERFPTMPVLLFVEQVTLEYLKKALRVGVSDVLSAPLRLDDILQAIENSKRRANRLGDWTRREVRRTTASLEQRVNELQKFDLILNNIEDGVIILDEQSKVLLINPAARRTFGIWKEEAVQHKPIAEVISHPDLLDLINRGVTDLFPHNEITFDDGRVLSAQFVSIPKVGVAITLQDITYLKQIDRLKTEFIHTVSHDLRSPLTAILGYVDLIQRVGPMNDHQKDFINRVQQSVQSITLLLNDLMELSRIEAGLDTQKEIVSLEDVIRSTLEGLDVQIKSKGQVLELKLPEELPRLRGNPIRLRQMLDNLMSNAIKYTPNGGKIELKVEMQAQEVILQIRDTGPGIPPADQPHIFEKFYRGSNVPRGVGGAGLGLAIVKSIMDSHGGRIWVDSVLGQGSTFTVVLPLARPDTVAA